MKLQNAKKQTIAIAIKATLAVGGCIIIYIVASMLQSAMEEKKASVETAYNQLQAEMADMHSKIENADVSEQKFASFITHRNNQNFTIKNEKVRDVLQKLISRYRLKLDGKLEYSAEKKVDAPEFATFSSAMIVREDTILKFSAISDVQAFSFMKDLVEQLPGIISFKRVKITRKGELDAAALAKLSTGQIEYLADAEIVFDWYGLAPVPTEKDANTSSLPKTAFTQQQGTP